MKQRYEKITSALCLRAAYAFLDGKWRRHDVLAFVEEYAGISRREIWADELIGSQNAQNEAAEGVACFLEDLIGEILAGHDPDCVDPVTVRPRADGMTGKIRQIACLSIPHQLLGHLTKLALDPLLRARILPTQHASIPEHGQTALKAQTRRYLRRKGLGIRSAQKIDGVHAYASIQYGTIVELLEREIPSARDLIALVRYLAKLAPDGHLIIGGYLDAWLFNLTASYAIRFLMTQGRTRRGKFIRDVRRVESYMDDLALLAASASGLRRAVKALQRWSVDALHMAWRTTTGVIRFLDLEKEREARRASSPARRGCPNLDVAGFRISRGHVTMRPRVFMRVRRCFLRAWRLICATGTVPRRMAGAITARYGAVRQTNSARFAQKYHVAEIVHMAKNIAGNWQAYQARKRRRWLLHAVQGNIDDAAGTSAA